MEGRDVHTYLLYCSWKGSLFLNLDFVSPHSVEVSKLVTLSELMASRITVSPHNDSYFAYIFCCIFCFRFSVHTSRASLIPHPHS
jgi:hypothetical protein